MNYTDPRCIRLRAAYGIEGYGLLHCLLDMLAANGGSMPADFEAIALHLSVSADTVRAVACDFNLFPPVAEDGLLRHPDSKAARPASSPLSRTERARRAALARWHRDAFQAQTQQAPAAEITETEVVMDDTPVFPNIPNTPISPPPPKTEPPTATQTELDLGLPPKPPRPLKQQAVALWCDTYKAQFGIPYQITPRDAGTISTLLQRIRKTAAQLGNTSPTDTELLDTLKAFYQTALSDPFINENATVNILSSQYNKIIKTIYANTTSNTANPPGAAPIRPAATRSRAARDNPVYMQDLFRRVAEAGAGIVSNTG